MNREEDEEKGEKSQRGQQRLKEDEEPESDDEGGSDLSKKKEERTLDASLLDMVLNEGNRPSLSPNGLLDSDKEGEEENEDSEKEENVSPEDLHYVFDKMIFTGGKVIMLNTIFPLFK